MKTIQLYSGLLISYKKSQVFPNSNQREIQECVIWSGIDNYLHNAHGNGDAKRRMAKMLIKESAIIAEW